MFCRYCGEENPENAVFCKNCGKELNEEQDVCLNCGKKIEKQTIDQMVDNILELPEGTKTF